MSELDNNQESNNRSEMTFLDHLAELRSVLIGSFLAVCVVSVVCWFFSKPMLDTLLLPVSNVDNLQVVFMKPAEAFLVRMKISFVCGLFIVLPYMLWRFYNFIMPGLYSKERSVVVPLLTSTVVLFYLGVAFAYLILIPKVIAFMLSFGTATMQPMLGVSYYFAFIARLCLAFGLMFELPLVVFLLSVLGVVEPKLLLKGWRYALVAILAFSAILTPPDVISQLIMAGPVMMLYILSVLVSMLVIKRKNRSESDDK